MDRSALPPAATRAVASATTTRAEERGRAVAQQWRTVLIERLRWMPEVARAKWERQLPIVDRPREDQLVAAFVAEARARGLSAEVAADVLRAQIAAAVQVQQRWHQHWESQPPGDDWPAKDLSTELRPALDRLTEPLLVALTHWLGLTVAERTFAAERLADSGELPLGVTVADWLTAVRPLRSDRP